MKRMELRDNGLLDMLRRDVWPLLSDISPMSKDDRERMLGYHPDTGVCVHGARDVSRRPQTGPRRARLKPVPVTMRGRGAPRWW